MSAKTFFSALILSASSTITFGGTNISSIALVAMRDSECTIEVTDGYGEKIENANFRSDSTQDVIRVAKIGKESSKFMLTVPNHGSNKINVTIYNEEGDLLLQEMREAVGDFVIVYDLAKARSYTFFVSDRRGNTNIVQY